jgi:50S ribosomal subunit-associated GTPase HflX
LEKKINYIIAYNKADLLAQEWPETDNAIFVSAKTGHTTLKH